MDSIYSWIDTEEVKRLAESLSSTPEKRELLEKIEQGSSVDIETDEHVEEVAREIPAEVVQRQKTMLADASAMANTAGLINSMRGGEKQLVIEEAIEDVQPAVEQVQQVAEVVAPVVEQPTEQLTESVETPASIPVTASGTFVDVESLFSETQGVCAVDRDGDVLYDSLRNPVLSGFIVSVLENSSVFDVAEGEVRNTRLKTYADQVVEFIAVRSIRGVVVVAVLLEKGMSKAQVDELGVKLVQTLNS